MSADHLKRKRTKVQSFDQASDLPADWDSGLPEGHFLHRRVLQAHEDTRLPDIKLVYAGIFIDGKWLARAAFQVLTIRPRHLNTAALKPWQAGLWRLFTRTLKPRLLVAGQLFRHDVVSFAGDAGLSPFEGFRLFRQITDKIAKEQCVQAILVKEPPVSFVSYFLHQAPGFLMLRNDSSMKLDIDPEWQTLADYEKSLKHKYAQRFRKIRQSWATLEVKELSAAEVTDRADELFRLYEQVNSRQPVRLGVLSAAFLPGLKAFYADKLKVWGIFENGELIAFASAWVQDQRFDMFYIGFDYERNASLQLYFNILYFSIEQAILSGKRQLILGRTALEAKARVGCRPDYLHTFLYIKNPVIRKVVARLQQRFSAQEGEWENRHPFKKEPLPQPGGLSS